MWAIGLLTLRLCNHAQMVSSAAQALVLSADAALIESLTTIFGELGIEAQFSGEYQSVRDSLESEKYDAVVLDFDTVLSAKCVLRALRTLLHSRNAVVFAVATQAQPREEAQLFWRKLGF